MKPTGLPLVPEMINYSPIKQAGDVIAVGDIHGRYDLLSLFLDDVKDTGVSVILLGDLIDRGPDDLGVLHRVSSLVQDPESWGLQAAYALRGNHEQMFLDACEGHDLGLWANNGGKWKDLDSMSLHQDWVKALPIYMVVNDTMFIHAGVFPGKDPAETIEAGRTESLVWVREPFMTVGPQLEKWTDKIKRVVHGHTPFFENDQLGMVNVSRKWDRIGIDTGAYFTGILTSYNATKNTFWSYETDA
jgi:serine/threonine protein phosphatase 1